MKTRIGIVGIGDIAKKAYLPVITRIQNTELFVFTRNKDTLKDIKKTYPHLNICSSMADLISKGIDGVMIHSATSSHYSIAKSFLEKGIPVFIDKPISNNLEEVEELLNLAKNKNILLRTGFNRRYVPLLVDSKKNGTPDIIIYQKNRTSTISDDQSFIFDDFIHVVDTTRFLMSDKIVNMKVKHKRNDTSLVSLHVFLENESTSSTLIMHRDSGKTEEKIELFWPNKKVVINELSNSHVYTNNNDITTPSSNWEETLHKRGFTSMINKFIQDIRTTNSFIEEDTDSLDTHKICQKIYDLIQK